MPPHATTPNTQIDGVNFVFVGSAVSLPPYRSIGNFCSFMFGLSKHLRSNTYDVIDTQPFAPLLAAFLTSGTHRHKLVATIHDVATAHGKEFFQLPWLAKAVEYCIYKLSLKTIVTVSHPIKAALLEASEFSPDIIHVVHNGVSLPDVDSIPYHDKVRDLIFVGRLVPSKGPDRFIDLCLQTNSTGAIIGSGPLQNHLRDRASQHDGIEFIGELSDHLDVLQEIKRSRALVLPSIREGFGIVLAEAGALGVPTLAYATGGVSDVIESGRTGFIVKENDLNSQLEKIHQILDPDVNSTMGEAAKKHIRKTFSWSKTATEIETVYLKVFEQEHASTTTDGSFFEKGSTPG